MAVPSTLPPPLVTGPLARASHTSPLAAAAAPPAHEVHDVVEGAGRVLGRVVSGQVHGAVLGRWRERSGEGNTKIGPPGDDQRQEHLHAMCPQWRSGQSDGFHTACTYIPSVAVKQPPPRSALPPPCSQRVKGETGFWWPYIAALPCHPPCAWALPPRQLHQVGARKVPGRCQLLTLYRSAQPTAAHTRLAVGARAHSPARPGQNWAQSYVGCIRRLRTKLSLLAEFGAPTAWAAAVEAAGQAVRLQASLAAAFKRHNQEESTVLSCSRATVQSWCVSGAAGHLGGPMGACHLGRPGMCRLRAAGQVVGSQPLTSHLHTASFALLQGAV
ncbi:hypothetical protein HaLaN_25059 [Haematococcus lacustris]|uniref:Uncharacterized protein n=1 Tax=Haematococcus lacustris TaxID=44745 RepID=A0A699ZWG9_HAELA|nr:hypothetical protein HaLaN_25059 [Haematococcus lacustris]